MNWNNLKQEKCPKCSGYLNKTSKYFCSFCNFSISFGKAFEMFGKIESLEKQANKLLK